MTTRNLKIRVDGPGDQVVLAIEIVGCACQGEDLQMALVGFVKQWKAERKSAMKSARITKPCGCQDAD